MITVLRKAFFSLLFSAFIFTGITALLLTGVLDLNEAIFIFPQRIQVLILTAVFLTISLIIFFYINIRQYFAKKEEDNTSCLVKFSDPDLIDKNEVVELEDISASSCGNTSILGRLFAFSSGNPELLQIAGNSGAGISGEVIYEHNGIHYINDDAFNGDRNTEREINNDFAQLVESVVNIKF
jgi:hypothetical protein